ncbi:MAG: lytic transglycosylase domain-containing protein [Nocardioides sp.]
MSKHAKYAPKHRHHPAPSAPKKILRNSVLYSSVAVAATGAVVSGGVLSDQSSSSADAPASASADLTTTLRTSGQAKQVRRQETVSRSDRRTAADPAKKAALSSVNDNGAGESRTEDISDNDPRDVAKALLSEFGFGQEQFSCLDSLYNSESGWRVNADNPSSSAYGIPQALPGSKMSSAGADWATNPVTQIRWGLGYIQDRYGSPCSAWSFKQGNNWY